MAIGTHSVSSQSKRNLLLLAAFSLLSFLVMGYHPGLEDDGVYLAAVLSRLHPALFPHDAEFFRVQLQATVFDTWMAAFVRLSHLSVAWAELLVQFASIVLMLYACRRIAARLFPELRAQWAGVAMVGAMLTLPVAGTALTLADQYLQPRNIASALILLAIAHVLENRRWRAFFLLTLSFVIHPLMTAFGISFCLFLAVILSPRAAAWLSSTLRPRPGMAALLPLGWIFEPPNPLWKKALDTRTYYYLYQWTWYEWLGALAPILLFWLLWRLARRRGETPLARFALAVFAYSVFQQVVAMLLLGIPALVRTTPWQPMRYLHLVYVFLCLIAGCLLGRLLLRDRAWRWAIYLILINGGMFFAQRQMFAASAHLELPGMRPVNPWLQAFAWVRQNTPQDAYFALDPNYLSAPAEDYHSFRALAQRSQLADAIKDAAVVTQVPELGTEWNREVEAQAGWKHFRIADFERLKAQFGVNWVLLASPPPGGLDCRWHNAMLTVCRIP